MSIQQSSVRVDERWTGLLPPFTLFPEEKDVLSHKLTLGASDRKSSPEHYKIITRSEALHCPVYQSFVNRQRINCQPSTNKLERDERGPFNAPTGGRYR